MDRADHLRAEQVGQIRRHRGEPAAVHRQDDAERRHEQRHVAQMTQVGNHRVQRKTQCEEHKVGVFAPQVIRERRPEESPANVEQAQQTGEPRGNRGDLRQLRGIQLAEGEVIAQQLAREHFLQQWRGHAQDADTGRNVKAQHQPHQRKLRGFPGHADVYMALGDHGVGRFFCRCLPALGFPAGRWHAVGQCAADHEHEVNRRHCHKALPHAHTVRPGKMVHQCCSQRRPHHCPATKAHDRHARSHAALVREPLDQCRHRRDIAQPQANTADNPRAQPHQPDLVGINTQCGNQQPAAPAQRRHHTGLARPGVLKPATPHSCRATQEDEKQGVDPAEHRNRPVALRREHLRDKAHVRCAGHGRSHAQGFG